MTYKQHRAASFLREHPPEEYCTCRHKMKFHNRQGCKIFMCNCQVRNTTRRDCIYRMQLHTKTKIYREVFDTLDREKMV